MKITLTLLLLLSGLTFTQAQPDTVNVGAYVISVHDINFRDKEYTMRFWLWFLYKNPDFDFSTQLDIINAKSIDTPEIILDSLNGKAWAIMKMKATMKESWKVADFPFDEQHLSVQIENSLFDNQTLVFKPDVIGSTYDKDDALDGWNIKNFKVSNIKNDYETGFGDQRPSKSLQNFSAFLIEMDIERSAWGLFMKIFIGMYIAFLISIISFTIKVEELEPRFGLPVGGLFATVGNKYIIDSILPETSAFTLVDSLHTLTFLAIFATLVVSAVALRQHDNGNKEASIRYNRIGSRWVVALYVIANVILIGLAIL
ncbi:MAG: hypothetical protein KBF45_07085 [Cyclobacteriaceae bacterium]|jgi:hypothetical protein|nr:hypothetical protein [Cyclobacteriaceae bacterium]